MKILIVGSGGREHAMAWKLNQESMVKEVFCAPGNPNFENVTQVNITDYNQLVQFAQDNKIDLTIVGPEIPLCKGIVDIFRAKKLVIFGPNKKAAQLEGSKDYSKKFMFKYNIPTAKSKTFINETDALAYLATKQTPIVIKADGLAAGKGVTVALDMIEAIFAVKNCFAGIFGNAGQKLIIEEFLDGEEVSIFAFLDGKVIKPLVSSQDHKRAYDNDQGLNTGGMGAYSPAPVVTDELMKQINVEILQPFLKGVNAQGLDYRGIIFIGIMITKAGIKVLEFNVRFGDPETQAILMRMKSSLFEAMIKTVNKDLSDFNFEWYDAAACSVVMASGGYPVAYKKNYLISGLDKAKKIENLAIFHAGTTLNKKGDVINIGGRVLSVTAKGDTIKSAVDLAYKGIKNIYWQDCFYRNDIAHRALK